MDEKFHAIWYNFGQEFWGTPINYANFNKLKELHLSVENAGYAEIERTLKIGLMREKENKKGELLSESIILKDDKTVNFKALLFVVYGYDNQERYANKKTKISKCEYLPKAFRENFPNDQEFSRIANKELLSMIFEIGHLNMRRWVRVLRSVKKRLRS